GRPPAAGLDGCGDLDRSRAPHERRPPGGGAELGRSGLAPEPQSPKGLAEIVEPGRAALEPGVVACMPPQDAGHHTLQPRRLAAPELSVLTIDVVHQLPDAREPRVGEPEP